MQIGYDIVTSAVIYDATFSGMNSIVLGTFGKVVLFYCPLMVHSYNENTPYDLKSTSFRLNSYFQYEFNRKILFKHSVMGLCQTHLSNNGACDLAVFTLNGVSIWQYEPEKLIELINQRFEENDQHYLDIINSKLASFCLNLNATQ